MNQDVVEVQHQHSEKRPALGQNNAMNLEPSSWPENVNIEKYVARERHGSMQKDSNNLARVSSYESHNMRRDQS